MTIRKKELERLLTEQSIRTTKTLLNGQDSIDIRSEHDVSPDLDGRNSCGCQEPLTLNMDILTETEHEEEHNSNIKKSNTEVVMKMAILCSSVLCFVLLLALIMAADPLSGKAESKEYCVTVECVQVASEMIQRMNMSVEPCDDFYEFACGRWINETSIPDGFNTWHDIYRLVVTAWEQIHEQIVHPSWNHSPSESKAADLYQACVNDSRKQQRAFEPLDLFVQEELGGWPTNQQSIPDSVADYDLTDRLIAIHRLGLFPLMWTGVVVDIRNNSRHVVSASKIFLDQDSWGNSIDQPVIQTTFQRSDQNPQVNQITTSKEARAQVTQLISYLSIRFGTTPTQGSQIANEIIEFEEQLAKTMTPLTEKRDSKHMYNLITFNQLATIVTFIDIRKFLNEILQMDIAEKEPIVVNGLDWLNALNLFLNRFLQQNTKQNLRVLDNYIKWRAIQPALTFVKPDPDDTAALKATGWLTGAQSSPLFCFMSLTQIISDPFTTLYLKLHPTAKLQKDQANEFVSHIKNQFVQSVQKMNWMESTTHLAALKKAEGLLTLVGYPDNLLNTSEVDHEYEELKTDSLDFFGNMMRLMQFNRKRMARSLRERPSRDTLAMLIHWLEDSNPMKSNAFYSFKLNRVVIPFALMQHPVFRLQAPRAINHGALGFFVAHELMHTFDLEGRHYDELGNVRDWWTDTDTAHYRTFTECYAAQYDNYTIHGHKLNGRLTNSEDLADNGALKLAYEALQADAQDEHHNLLMPGLQINNEQLFFVSFAQSWCTRSKAQFTNVQIQNDPHSPAKFRVLGPLRNFQPFADSFQCKLGSPMNPVNKCPAFWS